MSIINFGSRVSLREAAELIAAVGETNTVLLRGEKGVGKQGKPGVAADDIGGSPGDIGIDVRLDVRHGPIECFGLIADRSKPESDVECPVDRRGQ